MVPLDEIEQLELQLVAVFQLRHLWRLLEFQIQVLRGA
jgi:hypothetical protein